MHSCQIDFPANRIEMDSIVQQLCAIWLPAQAGKQVIINDYAIVCSQIDF